MSALSPDLEETNNLLEEEVEIDFPPLFFPVEGQGGGIWEDEQCLESGLQKNSLDRAIQISSSLLLQYQFAI